MCINCVQNKEASVNNHEEELKLFLQFSSYLFQGGFKCILITSLLLLDSVYHNKLNAIVSISLMTQMLCAT